MQFSANINISAAIMLRGAAGKKEKMLFSHSQSHLSAAILSIVLLIKGYDSRTALKWSTERENRLQYVSARTLNKMKK